ncbi:hypothetical protein CPB83DRAFT_736004, partial [Crepidotus variabilis]
PFNIPMDDGTDIFAWWQSFEGHKEAVVLPSLAIKIYAIRVNSMPGERTASAITWMTPALQSQLSIGQVGAKLLVCQHY